METLPVPPPFPATYPKYYLPLADHILFFVTLGVLCGLWSFVLYHPRLTRWGNIGPSGECVSTLVVAFSLAATCLPPVVYLGVVSEVYSNGALVWFHAIGILVATVVTAHLYVTVYCKAGVNSSLEYIGRRFGPHLRKVVAALTLVQYIIFLPFGLMVPAIIFQHVTQLKLWVIFLIFLCLLIPPAYCSSIRSVAWHDMWCLALSLSILITLIVFRKDDVGGITEILKIALDKNSLRWPDPSSDPYEPHTLWSLLIGGSVTWCTYMCFNPLIITKCFSVNSESKSQIALWLSVPLTWTLMTVAVLCGLLCYATFFECDPMERFSKFSFQREEMVIYMIMSKDEGRWFSGVFIATVIAASLGYTSFSLNVLCDMTVSEILRPFSPRNGVKLVRLLHRGTMIVYGTLCILPVLVSRDVPNIFMTSMQAFTAFGGPLLGLFTLSMFVPYTNKKGAFAGLFCGLAFSLWISIGHLLYHLPINPSIIHTVTGCPKANVSISVTSTTTTLTSHETSIFDNMYGLSYLWTAPISVGMVVIVGLLVSLTTKCQETMELDTNLLCPWVEWLVRNLKCRGGGVRRLEMESSCSDVTPITEETREPNINIVHL